MNIIERINSLLEKQQRDLIAIDGPCASGKSTYATELKNKFNATLFHMDDYFVPKEMKTQQRLKEIGGNVHYERFKNEILSNIIKEEITYQKFNCQLNALEEKNVVKLSDVIIVEGSYALHKELRDYYDIKILLKVDKNEQIKRLTERNPKLIDRFVNEWIPLENIYFEEEKLNEIVDYIIDTV